MYVCPRREGSEGLGWFGGMLTRIQDAGWTPRQFLSRRAVNTRLQCYKAAPWLLMIASEGLSNSYVNFGCFETFSNNFGPKAIP